MTTRISVLGGSCAAAARSPRCSPRRCAGAQTVAAKLRVLTPDQVLDPGTTTTSRRPITVPTDPGRRLLRPARRQRGRVRVSTSPTALSLLATRADRPRRCARSRSPTSSASASASAGSAAVEASGGQLLVPEAQPRGAQVGADQVELAGRPGALLPRAGRLPADPAELELAAPARAKPGDAVHGHRDPAHVRRPIRTVRDHVRERARRGRDRERRRRPGDDRRRRHRDGHRRRRQDDARSRRPAARDIPSRGARASASTRSSSSCARRSAASGSRAATRPTGSRAPQGADAIRARGGDDRVDVRGAGADRVDCGAGQRPGVGRRAIGRRRDRVAKLRASVRRRLRSRRPRLGGRWRRSASPSSPSPAAASGPAVLRGRRRP